jgi:hypothetical protein
MSGIALHSFVGIVGVKVLHITITGERLLEHDDDFLIFSYLFTAGASGAMELGPFLFVSNHFCIGEPTTTKQ